MNHKVTKQAKEYQAWYWRPGLFPKWKQIPQLFLRWEDAIAEVDKQIELGHTYNKIIKIEQTEFIFPVTKDSYHT